MEVFNLKVPKSCPGVKSDILLPINSWDSPENYNKTVKILAEKFQENFKRYQSLIPTDVIAAGPIL